MAAISAKASQSPPQLPFTLLVPRPLPRGVMRAHAARVVPHGNGAIDLAPFHALQQWLTLAGERRIAVPFAPVLADLLPATADRTRRDYRPLLATIQAVAFLQQCQRGRTPEGWVEATDEDYARVRKLLAPNFDTIAAEEVTEAVRKTVEAVKEGKELRRWTWCAGWG